MFKVKIAEFIYFLYNYLNWINLPEMLLCSYGWMWMESSWPSSFLMENAVNLKTRPNKYRPTHLAKLKQVAIWFVCWNHITVCHPILRFKTLKRKENVALMTQIFYSFILSSNLSILSSNHSRHWEYTREQLSFYPVEVIFSLFINIWQ